MAQDPNAESPTDATFKLPDGQEVTVPGNVRMMVPEMMFCPGLAEIDGRSIAEGIWNSVQ